jgi:hypothetical protein
MPPGVSGCGVEVFQEEGMQGLCNVSSSQRPDTYWQRGIPSGPLGFECSQQSPTTRPSVERTSFNLFCVSRLENFCDTTPLQKSVLASTFQRGRPTGHLPYELVGPRGPYIWSLAKRRTPPEDSFELHVPGTKLRTHVFFHCICAFLLHTHGPLRTPVDSPSANMDFLVYDS